MSVKFSGNTINKFGKMLPALYFEKIYLYDNRIKVKLAMYVNGVEDQEDAFATYAADYLNNLNYYVMFVLDGETSPYWTYSTNPAIAEYYPIDEIGVGGTRRLEKLLSGDKTILDLVRYGGESSMNAVKDAKDDLTTNSEWTAADVFTADIELIEGEWTGYLYSGGDSSDDDAEGVVGGGLDIPVEITHTTTSMGKPLLYPALNGARQNFYKFAFDDFSSLPETMYNANGSPIYKYVVNIDIDSVTMENFILQFHRIPKLSMVAFTTHSDLDITSDNHAFLAAARSNKGIGKLYDAQVSDATYEKVTNYGVVDSDPISIYVMPNQSEYDGTPIQAIDSVYYAPVDVTLEEITSKFKAFVGTGLSSDSQVQDIYNSLNYILEIYGGSPELLPHLDVFRKTFPSTSTADVAGRMYQNFKIMLYNANVAVKRGTVLMKKLIKSAVVMDYRSTEPLIWSPPAAADIEISSEDLMHNFINTDLMQINKYSLYTGALLQMANRTAAQNNIYINGYWFFDYERAIRKASNIAQLLPVNKIESYFGREVLNSSFTLQTAGHSRYRLLDNMNDYFVGTDGGLWRKGDSDADAGTPSSGHNNTNFKEIVGLPYPALINTCVTWYDEDFFTTRDEDHNLYPTVKYYKNYVNEDYKNDYGGGTWGSIQYAYDRELGSNLLDSPELGSNAEFGVTAGTIDTTHDYIRSFDFFKKLTIDGQPYRLMAFEFQELSRGQRTDYDYEPTFNDYLQFSLNMQDDTMDIYNTMVSQYTSMRSAFADYYDAAYEFCSYNNIDGKFNMFFQAAMDQQNVEFPEQAPWIIAPVIYHFHIDLLTDVHGGSFDKMIDAAIRESEGINPTTGRLEDVATFRNKIEDLYNINYDSTVDGSIAYAATSIPARSWRPFGGSGKTYFPLPELRTDLPLGAAVQATPTKQESELDLAMDTDLEITTDGATAETGVLKLSKMAFGFKQIPGETWHAGTGFIRISIVGGTQTLPNGIQATNSTAATLDQVSTPSSRDRSNSTGLFLYNSRWDASTEDMGTVCKPNTERYRTVFLYPGIEYSVTWYARDGTNSMGQETAPLIFTTANITVPSSPQPSSSGQKVSDQAGLDSERYNYYILRCGCQSNISVFTSTTERGLYGRTKTSFYDSDQSIWSTTAGWDRYIGYE